MTKTVLTALAMLAIATPVGAQATAYVTPTRGTVQRIQAGSLQSCLAKAESKYWAAVQAANRQPSPNRDRLKALARDRWNSETLTCYRLNSGGIEPGDPGNVR